MQNSPAIIVLCTAPNGTTAEELTIPLLQQQLAACITLLPGTRSFYYWEGKLEQATEVQMVIKSIPEKQEQLLEFLKRQHPYKLPELLVLPVQAGEQHYLSWLTASLQQPLP